MREKFKLYTEKLRDEVTDEGFRLDFLARFVVIWTLLTRIPLPKAFWPAKMPAGDRCLAVAPLAGGLLGLCSGGFIALVRLAGFNNTVSAWLGAAFYALSGWVLHLDGWGDVWDGFGSGRRGEELRAVMKDSRLGSFGAIGLVLAFGLWSSLTASIDGAAVIAALVTAGACGRFAACAAAFSGKYPWEAGMAKGWVDGFTGYDLFTAGVCLLLFSPLAPFRWLCSIVCAAAVGTFAAATMNSRLGGVNGDVLGASEVAAELFVLGVFSL